MTFLWHDLLPLRDAIDRKTAAVNSTYTLVFGGAPHAMNGGSCTTGYTDFSNRLCWLNAEAVKGTASEQFVLTTFLAAHERAHARWTDYRERDFEKREPTGDLCRAPMSQPVFDRVLHTVWNILEDERIERLLGRDFPHLHRDLRAGSRAFLAVIREANDTDDPGEVLQHILRRRVALRAGRHEPCSLSPANIALLERCEPLLDEAFCAISSRRVVELARVVLEILKLEENAVPEMDELSGQSGERRDDEARSEGASADEGRLTELGGDGVEHETMKRMSALGYTPGCEDVGQIEPAAYDELQRSVRPFVSRLRPLFDQAPVRRRVDHESSGSRLSVRAARRNIRAPFRVETIPVSRGRVALTLVIDDSGSMAEARQGRTSEREGKRTAMLCVNSLPLPHRVRVVLTPSGREAADPAFGEMSKARIAGYDAPSGTEYSGVLSDELGRLRDASGTFTRYLVLVADGETTAADLERCRAIAKRARVAGVHLFGIGIGETALMHDFFRGAFGNQYVALSAMESLVPQMQRILNGIARGARRASC